MAAAGLTGILVTTPVVAPADVARLVAAREKIADLADRRRQRGRHRGARRPRARASGRSACWSTSTWGRAATGVTDPETPCASRGAHRRAAEPPLSRRAGLLRPPPACPDARRPAREDREQWARLRTFLDALTRGRASRRRSSPAAAPAPTTSTSSRGRSPRSSRAPTSSWTSSTARSRWRPAARRSAPRSPSPRGSSAPCQPDRVIVDAGLKAMATDAGPALVAAGAAADATYQFMGDEHGGLRFAEGARAAGARRSRHAGRAALRPDRQPARPFPRRRGRAAGRHLADRSARLLMPQAHFRSSWSALVER